MRTRVSSAMSILVYIMFFVIVSCKDKESNPNDTVSQLKSNTNENVNLVSEKELAKEPKTAKPALNKLAKKYGIKSRVYTMDEVDRLPLFDAKCITAKNPKECSSDKLSDYITSNIDYPDRDVSNGNEGYEIVQFVIDKNGKVADTKFVTTKVNDCAECKEAVIKIFNEMDYWVPAQRDGKNVATELLVPIRFEIKNF